MLFNSLQFLMFFPGVCLMFWMLDRLLPQKLKVAGCNLLLLAGSYYFYMCWQPVYALLLLASTMVTWIAGLAIAATVSKSRRKAFLTLGIFANLAILFFFKYFDFVAESLADAMAAVGVKMEVPGLNVLLPVGISFYVFQALGYSIDVYRGKAEVERDFMTYALFVSFFPQLVAGPIERSANLLPQFKRRRPFDYNRVMSGLGLMLWGYFLKLALADRCAIYVDAIYDNIQMHNGASYLLASLFFTFQIYGDFAGYSLIAIGAAKVLGFSLMQNFRQPYLAVSVTDFWRRWHISLSTWFKDYVYIPLGGNRLGEAKCYRNILLTFLVSGLWHGANWTFVVWGALHGLFQCVERWLGWSKRQWTGAARVCHCALTFVIVCLLWVFFRAESLSDALTVIVGMVTQPGVPFQHLADFIAIALALALVALKDAKDAFAWNLSFLSSERWIVRHLSFIVMIMYLLLLGVLNNDQFIYFQF